MLFSSVKQLEKFPLREVPIGTAVIVPADKVKNLGVLLAPHLTMSAHVSRICSVAYYHLRDIGRIRPFLTVDTTERLVHAFVTSRLDMGNALFYGITRRQLQRLQRIHAELCSTPCHQDRPHPSHQAGPSAAALVACVAAYPLQAASAGLPLPERSGPSLHCWVAAGTRAMQGATLGPRGVFWLCHHHARRGATEASTRPRPQLWNSLPASVRRSPSLPAFNNYLKTHLYLTADWWLLTLLLLFLFLFCTAPRAHRGMALLEKLCIIIKRTPPHPIPTCIPPPPPTHHCSRKHGIHHMVLKKPNSTHKSKFPPKKKRKGERFPAYRQQHRRRSDND